VPTPSPSPGVKREPPELREPRREPATVVRVVDGDTVKVRLASARVESARLIGLNTPETVDRRRPVGCFGREGPGR
jgi:endonuclease YncB( thermonuclease family)